MSIAKSAKFRTKNYVWVAVLMIMFGAAYRYWPQTRALADDPSLLEGRVSAPDKQALAGIPVRAHRDSSNITVSVYTNSQGDYSFPAWSDVTPGTYTVTIELRDFEQVKHEGVSLSAGKKTRLDLALQPRTPSFKEAYASEIAMAEPGTDDQKFLLTQCSNCHTLQWALRQSRTKEDWIRIVKMMAGQRNAMRDTPGTRAFGQKQYIEPLADYLSTIRGPGSSDEIPFKLRPRPTGEASTRLVITEYDLPRGGSHELYMIRGDSRFVWPHDVIMDAKYAWYTDHFSYSLGRLDRKTGEAKEFAYTVPAGAGREGQPSDGRPGNPAGGAQELLLFDPQGNVVVGIDGATAIFDPKTEKFTVWPAGRAGFGMEPSGKLWFLPENGKLQSLDPKTGEVKSFPISQRDGIYGMATDSQGRSILNVFAAAKFGVYDPKIEKYVEYPTPTPGSGPRRGHIDAQDRAWVGLYWAGLVARFDPNNGEVREFPLIPDIKPYAPPFPAPYTAASDDKNQIVWATDFNSSRLFRIDMNTGKSTEYFMPLPYEMRDLTVDTTAECPTVWIPAYRPPSKLVKVQVR